MSFPDEALPAAGRTGFRLYDKNPAVFARQAAPIFAMSFQREIVKTLFTCILFILVTLFPVRCFAEAARIDNVVVSKAPALSISFTVKGAFTKEMEEAISSGIPASFRFVIELEKVNRLWFNDIAGKWVFRHTVKYNSLRDEYEITMDEYGDKPFRTKDFGEMKRLLTTCPPVTLIPSIPLQEGSQYDLKIMAELNATELPFILDYMLFFMKFWDFKTQWHIQRLAL